MFLIRVRWCCCERYALNTCTLLSNTYNQLPHPSYHIELHRKTESHTANEETPHLLWNPKVYYRVHKSPLSVRTLSEMNLIRTLTLNFPKIHFNIVLTSKPRFSPPICTTSPIYFMLLDFIILTMLLFR
jgi:hypothetical protein